jgi:UDP-2,3-diacylglucosamine pyrophosphatase LpxH
VFMKRIIISDLHIGSKFYKSEELLEFLKSEHYDELILAGDIIDFIKIPVFTERCLEIVKSINYEKRIIYVVGNHDESLLNLVGKKVGQIEFVKRYEFESFGRKFRVEHGDDYDKGVLHNRIFVKILSVIQSMLEIAFNFDFTTWWTEKQIKKHKLRSVIHILRHHPEIDVFIMGHNHIPEAIVWIEADQKIKTYINSGDWVTHQTYVSIIDGVARLKTFEPGLENVIKYRNTDTPI